MHEITRRTVRFNHFNGFTEKHGKKEIQKGLAMRMSFDGPNSILDEFGPGLRESLYRAAEPDDAKARAGELFETAGHTPLLRFPRISNMRWDEKLAGRDVVISYGVDERSDISLPGATIDEWTFEPKQGGSVTVSFRVKCYPDGDQMALLWALWTTSIEFEARMTEEQQDLLANPSGVDPDDEDPQPRAFPDALDGTASSELGGEQ